MLIAMPIDPSSLRLLLERRSTSALGGPPPSRDEIALLLQAAATVPDHGELRPYRFVVVDSPEGQQRFGDALADAGVEAKPELPPGLQDKLRKKAYAAPALVVVVASPIEGHKIPVWEQIATASCTGYAIVLAAHALGLGAIWKSAPVLRGKSIDAALALGAGEQVLGWINLGRPTKTLEPRAAVEPKAHALGADGLGALR